MSKQAARQMPQFMYNNLQKNSQINNSQKYNDIKQKDFQRQFFFLLGIKIRTGQQSADHPGNYKQRRHGPGTSVPPFGHIHSSLFPRRISNSSQITPVFILSALYLSLSGAAGAIPLMHNFVFIISLSEIKHKKSL